MDSSCSVLSSPAVGRLHCDTGICYHFVNNSVPPLPHTMHMCHKKKHNYLSIHKKVRSLIEEEKWNK